LVFYFILLSFLFFYIYTYFFLLFHAAGSLLICLCICLLGWFPWHPVLSLSVAVCLIPSLLHILLASLHANSCAPGWLVVGCRSTACRDAFCALGGFLFFCFGRWGGGGNCRHIIILMLGKGRMSSVAAIFYSSNRYIYIY